MEENRRSEYFAAKGA